MNHTKLVVLLVFLGATNVPAFASNERILSNERAAPSKPEIVKWIGVVKGDPTYHTTDHNHSLEFVRQSDGKNFDIVDSPELTRLHHETEKNFLAEIEAEKTSRFLFWGGNLIVKNFKVLKELETVAHNTNIHAPGSAEEGDCFSFQFDHLPRSLETLAGVLEIE